MLNFGTPGGGVTPGDGGVRAMGGQFSGASGSVGSSPFSQTRPIAQRSIGFSGLSSVKGGETRRYNPHGELEGLEEQRSQMGPPLVRLIEHYLSLHLHDTAAFLAERLISLEPNNETYIHLAACAYIYAGRRPEAIEILRPSSAAANQYLLARALVEEGQLLAASEALLRPAGLHGAPLPLESLSRDCSRIPNGAAGLYLLGRVAEAQGKLEDALGVYAAVLAHDPFMWCAYERMARMGKAPPAGHVLAMSERFRSALATQVGGAAQTAAADALEAAADGTGAMGVTSGESAAQAAVAAAVASSQLAAGATLVQLLAPAAAGAGADMGAAGAAVAAGRAVGSRGRRRDRHSGSGKGVTSEGGARVGSGAGSGSSFAIRRRAHTGSSAKRPPASGGYDQQGQVGDPRTAPRQQYREPPRTGMGRSTGGSDAPSEVSTDPRIARARLRGAASSAPSSKGAMSAGDLREPSSMFADARETMRVADQHPPQHLHPPSAGGLSAVPEAHSDARGAFLGSAMPRGAAQQSGLRSGSGTGSGRRARRRTGRTLNRSLHAALEIATRVSTGTPGSAVSRGADDRPVPSWPASAVKGGAGPEDLGVTIQGTMRAGAGGTAGHQGALHGAASTPRTHAHATDDGPSRPKPGQHQHQPHHQHPPPLAGDEAACALTPPVPMCLPGTPAAESRGAGSVMDRSSGPVLLPGGGRLLAGGSIAGLSPVGAGSGTGGGAAHWSPAPVWSPFDRSRFVGSGTGGAAHRGPAVGPPALPRHTARSRLAFAAADTPVGSGTRGAAHPPSAHGATPPGARNPLGSSSGGALHSGALAAPARSSASMTAPHKRGRDEAEMDMSAARFDAEHTPAGPYTPAMGIIPRQEPPHSAAAGKDEGRGRGRQLYTDQSPSSGTPAGKLVAEEERAGVHGTIAHGDKPGKHAIKDTRPMTRSRARSREQARVQRTPVASEETPQPNTSTGEGQGITEGGGDQGHGQGHGQGQGARSLPATGGTSAASVVAAQGSPVRGADSGSAGEQRGAPGQCAGGTGASGGEDSGRGGNGDEDDDDDVGDSAAKSSAREQSREQEGPSAGAMLGALSEALRQRARENKESLISGFEQVLGLLRLLGTAARELGCLRLDRARQAIEAVPQPHGDSPLALALRGEVELEAGRYALAAGFLQRSCNASCREPRAPVLLSTALWQLQRAGELGLLAERLAREQPGRAETWVVQGNNRALLRDHAGALACFRRASRLAPTSETVHVLAGHEHLACGDLDAAEKRYRTALQFSYRCYRAWYGLGMSMMRRDAPADAAGAYREAVMLHPSSASLRVAYAHALHAGGQKKAALREAVQALRKDGGNAQALFAAARWRLDDDNDARGARGLMLRLRRVCPREPAVLVLAARASRRLGLREEAVELYGRALELGPRDAGDIRAALESLEAKIEEDREGGVGGGGNSGVSVTGGRGHAMSDDGRSAD